MTEFIDIPYFFEGEPAMIPQKAYPGDSGYDIRAFTPKDITFFPWQRKTINTGLYLRLPPYVEAQVRPRSGLAQEFGITVLNSPGTIDNRYTGEIKVILINLGEEKFIIKNGIKIAQITFNDVLYTRLEGSLSLGMSLPIVSEESDPVKNEDGNYNSEQDRGDRGFGSSDSK